MYLCVSCLSHPSIYSHSISAVGQEVYLLSPKLLFAISRRLVSKVLNCGCSCNCTAILNNEIVNIAENHSQIQLFPLQLQICSCSGAMQYIKNLNVASKIVLADSFLRSCCLLVISLPLFVPLN